MTNLNPDSQNMSPSCVTSQSQHSRVHPNAQDVPPTHRIACQDDEPGLTRKPQQSQDEQPASSNDSQSQTQTIRQSSTIPEAVARYVGGPLMDNNVHPLIFLKPGPIEETAQRANQDDHPEQPALPASQDNPPEMTTPSHDSHNPSMVEMSPICVPPPTQDVQQISSLTIEPQPCMDVHPAPSHDSQNQTLNIRQSSTIPEAVTRYVDGPVMDSAVQSLIFDNLGPSYQPQPTACIDANPASLDQEGVDQQTLDGQPA